MKRALILVLWSGIASTQTISIVSGNGQVVVGAGSTTLQPLVVSVTMNGVPMANAPVNWSITSGSGTLARSQTVTDSNGRSSNTLTMAPSAPVSQTSVAARAFQSGVEFSENVALPGPVGASPVIVNPLYPQPSDIISGEVGQPASRPIQVQVLTADGRGVRGVEMRVISGASPSLTCPPALTDMSGIASCTPVFGLKPGTGVFSLVVGGNLRSFDSSFTVANGAPAAIRILNGNNQSGQTGTTLLRPLLVEVDDIGGNPLDGIVIVWDVLDRDSVTLERIISESGGGLASANVILGSQPGPAQIRVKAGQFPWVFAVFRVLAYDSTAQMQKLAGDGQEAVRNTPFPQPLAVRLQNQGRPAAGAPVVFSLASGSATLDGASTITVAADAQGRASAGVIAGPVSGPVVIRAEADGITQTFNLQVRAPALATLRFQNAASLQPDYISPCSLATIAGLGSAQSAAMLPALGPLPLQTGAITVRFGAWLAPIHSVGQDWVTVQVPCEIAPGQAPVTVQVEEISARAVAPVQAVSPGIFEALTPDHRRRALLGRPDGSVVTPEKPANPGEALRLYATGLGPSGTNQLGPADAELAPVTVLVNSSPARVSSVKYAHDRVGVYLVDFELPADVPAGADISLVLATQGQASAPSSIPVRQ